MPEEEETAPLDTQCLGENCEFHSSSNHNPALPITSPGTYCQNETGDPGLCHPGWQGSPGHLRVRTVDPRDCLPKHPGKQKSKFWWEELLAVRILTLTSRL